MFQKAQEKRCDVNIPHAFDANLLSKTKERYNSESGQE